MADRRLFARMETKFPLKFLNMVNTNEECAQVVDISAGGVGFVTNESLPVNTPLEMWLNIPDRHVPFYTKGEVAWSSPIPELNQQRVGVRLEKAELMGLARILWLNNQVQ
ncbi:MAG: PilZ domain-containing protein [bacterium]